jgi:hypothetical protein
VRGVAIVVFGLLAGCVDLLPAPVRHDIKDVKRKRDAQQWAGTYAFSDCAAQACWKYVIVVDGEADAIVTIEGPEPTPRVKAIARVYVPNKLDLRFESYADEKIAATDVGVRVFEPFRGRYTPGQPLAFLTRDASGRPCLTFDGMESKLGTKTLCTAAPPPTRPETTTRELPAPAGWVELDRHDVTSRNQCRRVVCLP